MFANPCWNGMDWPILVFLIQAYRTWGGTSGGMRLWNIKKYLSGQTDSKPIQYNLLEGTFVFLTLTTQNPPKFSKGHFHGQISSLLETGTFTSSNRAKLLPGKKYRP